LVRLCVGCSYLKGSCGGGGGVVARGGSGRGRYGNLRAKLEGGKSGVLSSRNQRKPVGSEPHRAFRQAFSTFKPSAILDLVTHLSRT